MFILIVIFILLALALLANERSRPFAAIAAILAFVGLIFPPAALVAGICLVIAVFRLFF